MREAQLKATLVGVIALALAASVTAQTVITPPENKYSPADDVKLGQEAAHRWSSRCRSCTTTT